MSSIGREPGRAIGFTRLEFARKIALNGDANGSVSFDGTQDVTIPVVVQDNSHNHIIGNVTGLQTALDSKSPTASPTFTGTVSGITASMVGLGNVTNESKATMFSSPTFTGTPAAPTATVGTNTTQIATTEFVLANAPVAFASGTTILFYQASAPTGWTKVTTHDNKALRVVSGTGGGSGGSTAFTSVFASRTPAGSVGISGGSVSISGGGVNETTLSNNQLAAHYHVGGLSAFYNWGRYGRSYTGINDSISDWYSGYTSADGYNTSTIGNSSSHTHSFTQPNASYTNPSGSFSGTPMDFNIQYVDVIIATKN